MKMKTNEFKIGSAIRYNDGRSGHNVKARVLSISAEFMVVQFEDRADTTTVKFADDGWMKFITLESDL